MDNTGENFMNVGRWRSERGQQLSHYALLIGTVAIIAVTMQSVLRRAVMAGLQSAAGQAMGKGFFSASPEVIPGSPGGDLVKLTFRIPFTFGCEATSTPDPIWTGSKGQLNPDASVSGEETVTVTGATTFILRCDDPSTADPDDRKVFIAVVTKGSVDISSEQRVDTLGTGGNLRATLTTEHVHGVATNQDVQLDSIPKTTQ